MAKKFISTTDMYRSKARSRRRRGAAMGGCLVSILQMAAIISLSIFALISIL